MRDIAHTELRQARTSRAPVIALGACVLLALCVTGAHGAVPVLDEFGDVIGESSFRLNASGTGERFFGNNAKQTLGISLVLDATGDETKLQIANATQRNDLHEEDPPYVQLESTTVTGSWSGPVSAFIIADLLPGIDLLSIELEAGHGRLARHGQTGNRLNLSGPLDPTAYNVVFLLYVNADGAETLGLPEGQVYALDALMGFVDEDDPSKRFNIGPSLAIFEGGTDVPIGEPIPAGQGLRGRIDQVSGRLRY